MFTSYCIDFESKDHCPNKLAQIHLLRGMKDLYPRQILRILLIQPYLTPHTSIAFVGAVRTALGATAFRNEASLTLMA
jgi:hypothetical protein